MNARTPIPEIIPGIPVGLPTGLRNYWYPVLQSEELPADRPVGLRVLGESLVAWRDAAGEPCVVRDRCPHRSMRLSVGRVLEGQLQCALHGLRFDGTGDCVLIPWEPTRISAQDKVRVQAYPAAELGGYVWAYIGDAERFPPPPLASEVPEELSRPDEFVLFRLPTSTWQSSWLLAIDGSDAYHAVTLHTGSQSAADIARQGGVPLADRRVQIVKTSHGIRGVSVDLQGQPIGHGHFTTDVKGERFALPCISTNPITPAPGAATYASRLWQFPIDERHTMIVRFLSFRAATAAERERATKTFEEIARHRLDKVNGEDKWAAEAQGDLIEARSHEHLLWPDQDVVAVRRMIEQAFVVQVQSEERHAVPAGALDFPV
ncbi:MAG: Rieske 2Fe-2S domain-containing protein [Burkholderiales bacterium]